MSRTKRTFSPEFKEKLVLEVLKGEKELNVIVTENDIQPNLLRNWKKKFLSALLLSFAILIALAFIIKVVKSLPKNIVGYNRNLAIPLTQKAPVLLEPKILLSNAV